MPNSSINLRFLLIVLGSLALLIGTGYLVMEKAYQSQMRNQASVVADNVESFGQWVANYGRVWVDKDTQGSFLGQKNVVDSQQLPNQPMTQDWVRTHSTTLYSKNPALAQREFSEVAWESSSPAKFRMTSDNYMNPLNKPDRFETTAITNIKNHGGRVYEEFDPSSRTYRYARAIVHKAGCISCHGSADQAPADVIERYGKERGFGFTEGDLAGVISVRLPAPPFLQVITPFIGAKEILLFCAAVLLPVFFMQFGVLSPIRELSAAATRASTGKDAQLELKATDQNTRNEIQQLGLAIKRLHTSTMMSLSRIDSSGAKKPTGRS